MNRELKQLERECHWRQMLDFFKICHFPCSHLCNSYVTVLFVGKRVNVVLKTISKKEATFFMANEDRSIHFLMFMFSIEKLPKNIFF